MTHQKFEGERTLMRIHIGESDKWHGKPLHEAIVELLRKDGVSGVTVLRVGVTSLFSDWSHEIATAILPAFLATIGAGPAWLGAIEGIADGLSSFAKLSSGHYTDQLKKRKPLAVFGYAFTALATASFAFATHAYHVLFGRAAAWLVRGVRSPVT